MPAPRTPGLWRGSGKGWLAAQSDANPIDTLHTAMSTATVSQTPWLRRARNSPYEAATAAAPVNAAPPLRMAGFDERSEPSWLAE